MDFSEAFSEAKKGKMIFRKGWNNPNIAVGVQFPDENSANTKPYLYMIKVHQGEEETTTFDRFPLDLSCESLFAEDWEVDNEGTKEK